MTLAIDQQAERLTTAAQAALEASKHLEDAKRLNHDGKRHRGSLLVAEMELAKAMEAVKVALEVTAG